MAGVGVRSGGKAGGGVNRRVRGVKIVIGVVAVARSLEGGDLGLGCGVGSVTANSARSTEGKASEDSDDRDDGEELDQGERHRQATSGKGVQNGRDEGGK